MVTHTRLTDVLQCVALCGALPSECCSRASVLSGLPSCLLQHCFMMPQSLGVIGGKPNSAHYFIGYVGESGLYTLGS